ncbi:MAG TPA: DNA gyrase C-terminal beta-propeller domain-containing protein, partial [Fibrella sp.]
KGSKGASSKDGDFTEHLYSATMHNTLLIFTQKGRMYWLPVYKIQEGARDAKGKPLPNYIQIDSDDKVRAVINVKNLDDPDYIKNNFIVMCTEQGTIKKTLLEAYSNVRRTGIIAITIDETDRLLDVVMTNGDNDLVIASRSGKAVRFHETRVRPMGRTAAGVKGITLDDEAEDDRVIGMVCIGRPDAQLLVISENGYGKRSPIDEYRVTNRGAKGVGTLKITEKVGALVGILQASDEDDLMVINRSGILLRTPVNAINVIGRNTQGVRIIKLREGDAISSVMTVLRDETEVADEYAEVVVTDDPIVDAVE